MEVGRSWERAVSADSLAVGPGKVWESSYFRMSPKEGPWACGRKLVLRPQGHPWEGTATLRPEKWVITGPEKGTAYR